MFIFNTVCSQFFHMPNGTLCWCHETFPASCIYFCISQSILWGLQASPQSDIVYALIYSYSLPGTLPAWIIYTIYTIGCYNFETMVTRMAHCWQTINARVPSAGHLCGLAHMSQNGIGVDGHRRREPSSVETKASSMGVRKVIGNGTQSKELLSLFCALSRKLTDPVQPGRHQRTV